MRLKGFWILGAIALTGLALATTGCGGGGTTTVTVTESADTTLTDTDTTDTTTTDTTTDETETDTDETTTDETDTTETETDSGETETETNALGFATSENCREFLELSQSISTAMSGTGDTDIQEAADAMQKFADEAPDDIKDDFQTLADTYSKIADALDGADLSSGSTPSAETMAAIANLSKDIDQAKLTAASSNISTWVTQNCTGG